MPSGIRAGGACGFADACVSKAKLSLPVRTSQLPAAFLCRRSSVAVSCTVDAPAPANNVRLEPATSTRSEPADAQFTRMEAQLHSTQECPPGVASTGWHPLTQPLLWQGSEEDALRAAGPPGALAPAWRVMLLSDGSVTRHLQLLTGLRVEECLEMRNIGSGAAGLPAATALIPGPLVQRQARNIGVVFLRSPEHGASTQGDVLVYATSWWSAAEVDAYLADKALPIWASLSAARTELYRDIRSVSCGSSPFLQRQFKQEGPFWGRQYLFWHGQRPLTLIHEVFSPSLQRFLGPLTPER